jgi:hypothetical protein
MRPYIRSSDLQNEFPMWTTILALSVFSSNNKLMMMSLDSSVGTLMGYRMDDQGLIPGIAKTFFSSLQHPDWFWGSPSLLPNSCQIFFPWG